LSAIVRVREGMSHEEAAAWLDRSVRLRAAGASDTLAARAALTPLSELLTGDVRPPLPGLYGAVSFVPLPVAATHAPQRLARATARERERAARRARGATRGRQIRQLLTESVMLALLGGGLGVLVAYWSVGALRAAGGGVLPRIDAVVIDWRVVAFSLAITGLMGLAAGIAPAIAAGASDPSDAFRGRDEHDLSTPPPRCCDLDGRRVCRHHHCRAHAGLSSRGSDRLAMVARGRCDDAPPTFLRRQPAERVGSASQFERTGRLQRLGLEQE
jgi:hypothetical protein